MENRYSTSRILISIFFLLCLYQPKLVRAITYGTITDGDVCGSVHATGFASVEEAGISAWNDAWCLNNSDDRLYAGIIEYGTNYWWSYYQCREEYQQSCNDENQCSECSGPWRYYTIWEEPYYFSLQEPPLPQSCGDSEGNPCNPATGIKHQTFIDYQSSNKYSPKLIRYYSSQNNHSTQFAPGWNHNFSSIINPKQSNYILKNKSGNFLNDVGLHQSNFFTSANLACLEGWLEIKQQAFRGKLSHGIPIYSGGNVCQIMVDNKVAAYLTIKTTNPSGFVSSLIRMVRSNGQQYYFKQQGETWIDHNYPSVSLIQSESNWLFMDEQDNKELFNSSGRLIEIQNRNGLITQLEYELTPALGGDGENFTLDSVTGPFGRKLIFSYFEGKLISVNTPDGKITFSYDQSDNLLKVTYPNKNSETYHYENRFFPHHLTGITDANNTRFATWDYDNEGKVILSEHAGHNDRIHFTYNDDGTTDVLDELGASRKYYFQWKKRNLSVSEVTGDYCKTCGSGHMKSRNYDENGNLSSYSDWNNNTTVLETDDRGLITCEIQAYNSPTIRLTKTVWHSDFRLPILKETYSPVISPENLSPTNCNIEKSLWNKVKTETFQYTNSGQLYKTTVLQ